MDKKLIVKSEWFREMMKWSLRAGWLQRYLFGDGDEEYLCNEERLNDLLERKITEVENEPND